MNLQQLGEAALAGRIEGLDVVSLEGGFYILQARLASGLEGVLDDEGQVLRLRSTTQLRDLLQGLPRLPCDLVQHCVHDEMCGVREGPLEPMRLPLSLDSQW
ncbi:DUF6482 family protein [Pseudomonas sp. No.21]|jgi:hypothetical protein|uniref:DUF6482 family protein n=1 Tax=Pseudomonas TaxID=286 RepID=UPI000DA9E918|nr:MULTISPECIES: DUF6482 family protein [Pseudomonas]MDW3715657.1 DUF6482 family protein [Pseudomonas sp. 2023EL-01195]PZE12877.1 metal ABC transporter ATPase [Pseudomonas sp. 57B-090624]GJN46445.1 hypothetical protein TUM20249_24310 [Pseudomonas tohonis]